MSQQFLLSGFERWSSSGKENKDLNSKQDLIGQVISQLVLLRKANQSMAKQLRQKDEEIEELKVQAQMSQQSLNFSRTDGTAKFLRSQQSIGNYIFRDRESRKLTPPKSSLLYQQFSNLSWSPSHRRKLSFSQQVNDTIQASPSSSSRLALGTAQIISQLFQHIQCKTQTFITKNIQLQQFCSKSRLSQEEFKLVYRLIYSIIQQVLKHGVIVQRRVNLK